MYVVQFKSMGKVMQTFISVDKLNPDTSKLFSIGNSSPRSALHIIRREIVLRSPPSLSYSFEFPGLALAPPSPCATCASGAPFLIAVDASGLRSVPLPAGSCVQRPG